MVGLQHQAVNRVGQVLWHIPLRSAVLATACDFEGLMNMAPAKLEPAFPPAAILALGLQIAVNRRPGSIMIEGDDTPAVK